MPNHAALSADLAQRSEAMKLAWLIFIVAAALEVCGDALIRKGLRGNGLALIGAGCLALSCYGLIVNLVKWDFSKLLGVYVAVFALLSVLTGRVVLKEDVTISTWLGLVFILVGGLVIQFGNRVS
jgi:drug/metabolite transporter superfamily protein YnfA